MTRFLLIRHAHHAVIGKALAGRSGDTGLDAQGFDQARAIARRLADRGIGAVYTSPQRRARETAAPLGEHLGLEPIVENAIDEIDFGDWTGRSFADLTRDPQWTVWVDRRSLAQPPNGERFADVQRRAVNALERLAATHPHATLAFVSHGDVIKAAIAHVLGLSLDHLERFDVAPASVSTIVIEGKWARVELVNDNAAA